jgi:hypothetical protein
MNPPRSAVFLDVSRSFLLSADVTARIRKPVYTAFAEEEVLLI